jgi:hypothetical protein
LFGVYCFGLLIYTIVTLDISGLIFTIFFYLAFFRKIMRIQSLTFDENYIYTKGGNKISYDEINSIVDGKITIIKNSNKKVIYVNPYFPAKNHKLFMKYYNSKKLI